MARALLLTLALVILAAGGGVSASFAQPHMMQTDCDTLSLDPPRVRIGFAVANSGDTPVCRVRLAGPEPADSCDILACASPPGWFCFTTGAVTIWEISSGVEDCVDYGETLPGFQIEVNPFGCCYGAAYAYAGIPESFYGEYVCFECDKPVQTSTSTWGRMKNLYR